jgi:phenylacetate-CoA ligase
MKYGSGCLQWLYNFAPVPIQNLMASIYGLTVRRKAYGRYFRYYFDRLQKTQWLSDADMAAYQREEMRSFLEYANLHSVYWRDQFRASGFDPVEYQKSEDLRCLPIMYKETLRQQERQIEAVEYLWKHKPYQSVHSSGTTGKAIHLKVAQECFEREYAFRWLHRSWGGNRLGDQTATFAGHPVVPTSCMKPPFWRLNWPENQVLFSSQHIALETLPFYANQLVRMQPDLINGYPSSLYLVASYLKTQGVDSVHPKAVYTHSENLLDYQRVVLEAVFACKVLNWYGNTELTAHIVECEEGSLHIKPDHSLVEIVREDGELARPGEIGEIVGTGFGNYATPLIRYATGDMARLSDRRCECNRPGPIVEELMGRVEDIVVTPDGRHVGRLDHVFKDMLNVVEAQIIQDTVDVVRVCMVKRPEFGENDARLLERELRLRLGPMICLEYEFVDAIPRLPNGKFRFVVSKVPLRITGARQAREALGLPSQG